MTSSKYDIFDPLHSFCHKNCLQKNLRYGLSHPPTSKSLMSFVNKSMSTKFVKLEFVLIKDPLPKISGCASEFWALWDSKDTFFYEVLMPDKKEMC